MRLIKILFVIGLLLVFVSCSNESAPEESEEGVMEEELAGYVLHVEAKRFLMVDTDDEAVYQELKDLTMEEMLQGDPDIPLVYVNYSNVDEINEGDQVVVDYDGVMTFSIPGQISGSNVTKVE